MITGTMIQVGAIVRGCGLNILVYRQDAIQRGLSVRAESWGYSTWRNPTGTERSR